jgi:SAM-dependent methyltransferase
MAPIPCSYCRHIRTHAPRFRVRTARRAIRTAFPRCEWHWQFVCAKCGNARHFNGMAFCDRGQRFFCIDCAPEHRPVRRSFWGWNYYYRLRCPWHSEWHGALDRLEYEGRHPWQLNASWERARRGLSRRRDLAERWSFRIEPIERITEAVSRASWDASAGWWTSRYSERGDPNREWVIDPALFRLLGDVKGQSILDAGCGSGYLARLLAAKGAKVVGVDHSARLLEVARRKERQEPLGLQFHKMDLARLSPLASDAFDIVVSNVVMQDVVAFDKAFREFSRILRPGGRLVFSVTHPCFERPVPGMWVREPPDTERIEEWRGVLLDWYYDRVALWWGPQGQPAMVGFHRTLEDYAGALRAAGLLIARIEEPKPVPEAIERMHRQFADYLRVPNFLIVEAVRPKG